MQVQYHLLSGLELLTSQLLFRHLLDFNFFLPSGHNLFFLGQDHLNMTRTAHVWIDSSMRTKRPPSHVRSTVDLNVVDHKGVHIKPLNISIGFCVLEKLKQEFGRLDRPSALRATMGFSLSFTPNTAVESSEWNDLLLCNYILQVSVGLPDVHLLDGLSCLSGVLEVHAEIRTSCFARFG